ncbi:MAG: cobalamin-dependent protein [Candidatus Omnitrophica bacterium]|nr:cobalamin-dependent protein [Candidatus Omnitrophota bacterium]
MAKVYLISPPYYGVYTGVVKKNFGVLQPPLGLAYVASYLKSRGHSVKLFDSSFSKDIFKDINSHMHEFNPTFVGITATTPQITSAFKVAEYIKSVNPTVKVILGGPHVSALPEEALSTCNVDIIVCGEGEITFSEIVDGKELNAIQGICFKQDKKIVINSQRPLIENLDSLPFPLWEQLPVKSYYYVPRKTVGVMSTRGCPYRCSFCASGVIFRHQFRMRSPLNFVSEIEFLHKKFGVNNVMFIDETFTINHERVEEICNLILEKKLPLQWTCDTRVDSLTKKMLKTMKLAGCNTLRMGIESSDEAVLEAVGKPINLEQAKAVVSWARECNIKTVAYYLLGLPHETIKSLEKTLVFAKKLKTDLAHFSMLVPLPGTKVWDIVKEGKILRCTGKEWRQYTRYDKPIVESDTLSKEQLLKYYRHMIRSYFFSPAYMLQTISAIKSFRTFNEYLNSAITFSKMFLSKS